MTFVQIGEFEWLSGHQKGLIFVKMFKVFFSETIWGMKPNLGIHAKDISLYISCVFYSGQIRTLVAMATYSSHRLIMGKVEIDNFCQAIGGILDYFLQKCLLSSPPCFI